MSAEEHEPILLSPPHMGDLERKYVEEAFATNWIAPVGPHVDAFEREFAERVGAAHAVALSSGTAALHLALQLAGVGPGDDVLVATLTFAATANPVVYLGGTPVFVDSERSSWNVDPGLIAAELERRAGLGRPPAAVVVVHLFGQSANLDPILAACERHGVPLIEDAAEALGTTYGGRQVGTSGRFGVFSFNGNKVITTSGGGMLVTADADAAAHVRKLATQAREPAPHYEHAEIGYNYRLSNVLAGIGRGQLAVLDDRLAARRRNFEYYEDALGDLPGLELMPEAPWGRHTRWLTTLTIDSDAFGADREELRLALTEQAIDARPVWKPLHLQPVFRDCPTVGGDVAADLFERGLCLPSGSALTVEQLDRVVGVIRSVAG